MATSLPSVTCGANQSLSYGSAHNVTLTATATNSPESFTWTLLSYPVGSTASSETRGSFVNGSVTTSGSSSSVTFLTDANIEGSYVFQCVATNNLGDSVPSTDKENGQLVITIKTQSYELELPNDYQYDWALQNNNNFLELEDRISSQGLGDHTSSTLAQLNSIISDATLIDTGDSRLSDSREPSGDAGGALSGTYPNPSVVKLRSNFISTTTPSEGQFLGWNNTNSEWEPKVVGAIVGAQLLPQLTWSSATEVNVANWPGKPSTVYVTLDDDIQRSFTGTLTFDITTSGEGGLDTGSEASDTWYYLYLVPKGSDDTALVVVGSTADPDTGPTGYTYFKYIGAVYNDSGSDIRKFQHSAKNKFEYLARQLPDEGHHTNLGATFYTTALGDPSVKTISLTDVIPDTANIAILFTFMRITNNNATSATILFFQQVAVEDETDIFARNDLASHYGSLHDEHAQSGHFEIPILSGRLIQYRTTRDVGGGSIDVQNVNCCGWYDAYLT